MAEGVGVVETVSAALYTVRWKAQSLWDMKTRHGAIGPTLNESVWFMAASCVVKGRTILAPEGGSRQDGRGTDACERERKVVARVEGEGRGENPAFRNEIADRGRGSLGDEGSSRVNTCCSRSERVVWARG